MSDKSHLHKTRFAKMPSLQGERIDPPKKSLSPNGRLAKRSAIIALFVALVALGIATVSGLIRSGSVPHWRSLLASVVSSFALTFALTFALNYSQQSSSRRRSVAAK